MSNRRPFKLLLVDMSPPKIMTEGSLDLDSNSFRMRTRENFIELGEGELVQLEEGRINIDMLMTGTYTHIRNYAPDVTRWVGSFPFKGKIDE